MKRISQRCFLFSVILVTGMTVHGESVVGYYIGAKAHSLARVDNWKDSIRPGRFDDGGVTNGASGGTMIFDDQATGWGNRLTSTALVSISNMIFSGSSEKTFEIPEYNKVRFESGGRLEVAADSGKTLSFNTGARLLINDVTQVGQYVEIVNHAAGTPLLLGSLGNTQTSSENLYPEFRFSGEGDIVLHQSSDFPNGYSCAANGSLAVLVLNQTGVFRHAGQHDTFVDALIVPPSDTARRIELTTKNMILRRLQNRGAALAVSADTLITGSAGLDFGRFNYDYSKISVAQGKTLTLDVATLRTSYEGASKGIWFEGKGTTVLTDAVKNLAEGLYIETSATVKAGRLGCKGAQDSPIGTNTLSLANAARFVYTGPGETTDRGVKIRYASSGYLEQAGTGPLVFTGDFSTPASGSSTLYLVNETDSEATYSGLLANNGSGTLAVVKQGGGLWRINCAATYTGATTVQGGVLALGESGSLAASDLKLKGGVLRLEQANVAFRSLTLEKDTSNGLSLADGVVLTLPTFERQEGATLDVELGVGAELTMTGFADGRLPAWLTVNGKAGYLLDGRVKTVNDLTVSIDAKGGQIPSLASAVVGITTAGGSGTSVALDETVTDVLVVNQQQDVVDAEIALKGGETLNVSELVVSEGAKDLSVTARNGAAVLAARAGAEVRLNPAAGTALSLQGALVVPAAEFRGAGTVRIGPDVALTRVTMAESPVVETAAGDLLALEACSISNAAAIYAGAGTLSVSDLNLGGAGSDDARLMITGGTVTNQVKASTKGLFQAGATYLLQNGGTFVEDNTVNEVVYWGQSPSQVTFEQTGGMFSRLDTFALGHWDSQVSFYVSGGTCALGRCEFPAWGVGCNKYTADGDRLNYVLTVDGAGVLTASTIVMGRIKKDYADGGNEWANPTMINFNGGRSQIYQMIRDYRRSQSPSSRVFVNFNGGTLTPTHTTSPFGAPESVCDQKKESAGVDRVTVFAGGGTLDTAGRNVSSCMPFSAPFGNGVVSVPLPENVRAKTFRAPPAVTIIGDGEGASARVLFNPQTGRVTGVQILSPGWGYQTARARFNHGKSCLGESPAALAPVAGGVLTKAGEGSYTFLCANTVTRLNVTGGSLCSGVDAAFPPETALVLDGGAYDLNGYSQSFRRVTFGPSGGGVRNGTAAVDTLAVDFAAAADGRPGVADLRNLDFSNQANVSLEGYDPALLADVEKVRLLRYAEGGAPASPLELDPSVELPKGWFLQSSANRLMLLCRRPLVMTVR